MSDIISENNVYLSSYLPTYLPTDPLPCWTRSLRTTHTYLPTYLPFQVANIHGEELGQTVVPVALGWRDDAAEPLMERGGGGGGGEKWNDEMGRGGGGGGRPGLSVVSKQVDRDDDLRVDADIEMGERPRSAPPGGLVAEDEVHAGSAPPVFSLGTTPAVQRTSSLSTTESVATVRTGAAAGKGGSGSTLPSAPSSSLTQIRSMRSTSSDSRPPSRGSNGSSNGCRPPRRRLRFQLASGGAAKGWLSLDLDVKTKAAEFMV